MRGLTQNEKANKKLANKVFIKLHKDLELLGQLHKQLKEDNSLTSDIKSVSGAYSKVSEAKTDIAFLTITTL